MRTASTSIPQSDSGGFSFFRRNRESPVFCYAITAISISLALIITRWLKGSFPESPVALFYCAIILSSWIGGIGPGILASLLSILTIKYYFSPPLHTFAISLSELPRLVMLMGAGVFIGWLSGQQKRAQVALRQARDELEQRVNERTKELTVANEGLRTEIAGRKRTETLLDGQRRVLEMMAANAPLSESLAALTRLIEAHVPDMLGSILLIDKEGVHLRHGAAPSLPSEYMAAIDGVTIGPDVGSCGTAAYLKEAVIVEDIATDSRWKNHRMLALSHGLRACWSTPIFDTQQSVVGTFAMYYRHTALPEPEHLRLIEIATHIAAIAICRDHSQAALRESEAKLNEAQRIANIGYWERDLAADLFTWSEGTSRIFGFRSAKLHAFRGSIARNDSSRRPSTPKQGDGRSVGWWPALRFGSPHRPALTVKSELFMSGTKLDMTRRANQFACLAPCRILLSSNKRRSHCDGCRGRMK
jgi:PAS domain-containing protein